MHEWLEDELYGRDEVQEAKAGDGRARGACSECGNRYDTHPTNWCLPGMGRVSERPPALSKNIVDLFLKCYDLSEWERDYDLGAVDTNYGPHWFSEFIGEVLMTIRPLMTEEEKREADRRLW